MKKNSNHQTDLGMLSCSIVIMELYQHLIMREEETNPLALVKVSCSYYCYCIISFINVKSVIFNQIDCMNFTINANKNPQESFQITK